MNSVFVSWRSTFAGIIVMVAAIIWMSHGSGDKTIGAAMVAAGLGLVAAKDSNVSGIPSVHVPEADAVPDPPPGPERHDR